MSCTTCLHIVLCPKVEITRKRNPCRGAAQKADLTLHLRERDSHAR